VVTAGNAADALNVLETDPPCRCCSRISLCPGELNGFDLGRRVEAIRPDIKTLYMMDMFAVGSPPATRRHDQRAAEAIQAR